MFNIYVYAVTYFIATIWIKTIRINKIKIVFIIMLFYFRYHLSDAWFRFLQFYYIMWRSTHILLILLFFGGVTELSKSQSKSQSVKYFYRTHSFEFLYELYINLICLYWALQFETTRFYELVLYMKSHTKQIIYNHYGYYI